MRVGTCCLAEEKSAFQKPALNGIYRRKADQTKPLPHPKQTAPLRGQEGGLIGNGAPQRALGARCHHHGHLFAFQARLTPGFGAHHHDRMIVGGLAPRVILAAKSESRRLDLATQDRRVDAVDRVRGGIGRRDVVVDDVDAAWLQHVEHFRIHPVGQFGGRTCAGGGRGNSAM